MNSENISAKERIFQTALELVDSEKNITSRQLASKADVNVALINYYFQSKENLMSQVAAIKMDSIIKQLFQQGEASEDSKDQLKKILVTTADFSFEHNEIFKIAVAKELREGCANSCSMIMPLLKKIFPSKTEAELRITAIQLLIPCHQIVLNPQQYSTYLDTDFFDKDKRAQKINEMVDNILITRSV